MGPVPESSMSLRRYKEDVKPLLYMIVIISVY